MNNPDLFEQKLAASLDKSIETLPAKTVLQLENSRALALQAQKKNRTSFYWSPSRKWAGASAFGLSLAILLILNSSPSTSPSLNSELAVLNHFAEMTDEELELVEDLEFALWLLDQDPIENPS